MRPPVQPDSIYLQKVVLLNILEVLISTMLQFVGGIFIADNDGMGVLLQAADSPHVVDGLFDPMTKGAGLVVAIHHNHKIFGSKVQQFRLISKYHGKT